MRVRRTVAGLLGAALLALTSCGEPTESAQWVEAAGAPTAAGASEAPGSTAPTGPVPEILSFKATTIDGKAFSGATLANRPAVLWFWAPWCATCASQGWAVAEQSTAYAGRVPIVGVGGLSDDVGAMKSFVTDTETAGVPQINDASGDLWRRFKITEQSTYVMLDSTGKVLHRGWLDDQDLDTWLKRLAG